MAMQRRKFLKSGLALGFCAWGMPQMLFAEWPKEAFNISDFQGAVNKMLGNAKLIEKNVKLTVPKIAENGAQVRVKVEVSSKDVEWISIFVEKNPVPLTSRFMILDNAYPHISTNVKVRETSQVLAVAKIGDDFYGASEIVKVTAGGCA